MRPIESLDEFRAEVQRVGLGELPEDELLFLKHYYDDAVEFAVKLREVVTPDDEPATVFKAGSPA